MALHGSPLFLADEFYLVAHHDVTGRPRQHPRSIALSLAAGLLAELVLDGRITVRGDALVVVTEAPPADALAHTVLDQVVRERQQHSVGTWLAYLGQQAPGQIAARLERAGLLARQQARRFLRAETAWVPTDISAAAWPGMRLRLLLQREQPMDMPDVVLAGLVDAIGLSAQVLWDVGARTIEYRDFLLSTLPDPLRNLVAHTSAAVGKAVLTHRA
jgi:hypothetical protein